MVVLVAVVLVVVVVGAWVDGGALIKCTGGSDLLTVAAGLRLFRKLYETTCLQLSLECSITLGLRFDQFGIILVHL